jgi:hypothetical protein
MVFFCPISVNRRFLDLHGGVLFMATDALSSRKNIVIISRFNIRWKMHGSASV